MLKNLNLQNYRPPRPAWKIFVGFSLFAVLSIGGHDLSSAWLVQQAFQPFPEAQEFGHGDVAKQIEEAEVRAEESSGVKIKNRQRKSIYWPELLAPTDEESGQTKAGQTEATAKVPLAMVYLHGFSAGPLELDPTIHLVAQKAKAALFVTRLAGHGFEGQDGAAAREMGRVDARDWWRDVHEAMAVGRTLSDRIVLVGTSTGAALAISYVESAVKQNLELPHALILLSPNYRVQAFGTWLLEAALGRWLATVLIGPENSFNPLNEMHSERWTSRYRSEAVHEMLLVAKRARQVDVENLPLPVLTVFSPHDTVVDTNEIIERAGKFQNADSKTVSADWLPHHQLASAAFNPELIPRLVEVLVGWIGVVADVKSEIRSREDETESSKL